ncbi:MAG TPA: DUF748 domain-containing protein [Bacteroidia bacterium]|nr:DUF748 domain-containing protein [Bacteroidia bacterium]
MKSSKSKLKKTALILLSLLIVLPILILIFASPITKYLVEKYSVKYTGRQIRMDKAYVNPFTGYVHFSNVRVYEATTDSIFFSADGLSMRFALHKMLSKTYEISELTLDKPKGIVILNKRNNFNFSDIINRFSPSAADTDTPPLHFNILNVKINDGTFYFHDTLIHIDYFIKSVNFESSGKRWNNDSIKGKLSFSAGIGTGDMEADFIINLNTLNYYYAIKAHQFNLALVQQYLRQMINYGTFSANLDADLKTSGNFKDENDQDTKGRIAVNDFHFGKTTAEDYLAFDKFVMTINEVNPKQHIYHLDSVTLTHPYFKFEKYDKLDNIETMFGEKGANVTAINADNTQYNLVIELAHYLIDISKNFFQSAYTINRVAFTRGNLKFNDFSRNEEFSIAANPLSFSADSVNQGKGRIKFFMHSGISPYGEASLQASVNPRDSEDFDVNFHFGKIPISLFNPYLITYTSFPLDRGTLELNGAWKVKKGVIQSENHLLIIDPRVGKRVKNKANTWIPMWLVMAFIRDRSNVIEYSVPITGDLRNPKLHLHDVLFSILRNIFVKPPTTAYGVAVKNQESTIEKSLTMKWNMRQSSMSPSQERFMKKLAGYLSENPNARISVYPEQYAIKEKEYILFFEAKKRYYLSWHQEASKAFSEGDSEKVDRMSIRDTLFLKYLNKHVTNSLMFTIQDKCTALVGNTLVNLRFQQLNTTRKKAFNSTFDTDGLGSRVTFNPPQNNVPYNGLSFYRIEYKGDLPGFLLRAYKDIGELNDESPREEYKKDRKKIKAI